MSEDQERKDRIIRHIEKLTENKLEQLNIQQLMRKAVTRMERDNEEEEEVEEEDSEEDGELVDKALNSKALSERLWAEKYVWNDYLKNLDIPLQRRIRTAICLSLRVPPAMQKELKGVAKFNKKTGRIEQVDALIFLNISTWNVNVCNQKHFYNHSQFFHRRRCPPKL